MVRKPMDNNAINKNMTTNTQETQSSQPKKAPDEQGGILVQSHIKIFDPETKEVFVNGRA
jgi:hypothetical protein